MTAAAHVPLDLLDHIARYPVPPVSRSRAPGAGVVSAPTVAPLRARGPTAHTKARLDAMRGRGRLTTKQVQALWLKAGVPAGVGGPLTMLTHYLGNGWVTRPVQGKRNVCALWEVV